MKKNKAMMVSLVAVLLGLMLGFVVAILTGRNPLNMLYAILRSLTGFDFSKSRLTFNVIFILNWFVDCVPLILTGLSVAFAYRTGLFNIGAEGQYMIGSTVAAAVALYVKAPPLIHVTLCILAAMLAGALWGAIPGLLKATRNIHEVVICIMMNYIGWYVSNWLVRGYMPIYKVTNDRTIEIPSTARIERVFANSPSQFNWGFVVVIIAIILFWFIIEKTTFGYSLKATGFNKDAANFAGMKVKRNIVYSMMISGAIAGSVGALLILGIFRYGRIFTMFDNYGFTGIPVALVGAANAWGVALAGMLFGLLKACSNSFQLFGIPKEISELIQASIIFLVAIQYGIIYVLDKLKKNKNEVVEVLGEGERD